MAVSLLEEWGSLSWEALAKLARSDCEDAEYFIALISRCEGVDEDRRLDALKALARSRYPSIRMQAGEAARQLSSDKQRTVFELLAHDTNEEVRELGKEWLADLQ
jgi:hypothetical protein